ncbi:unnamed protein product [Lepeophtheirus salmonis]|uniref:(salmon louse) hypothetical protein n=1 Tax=Lepeophtheirus salmonis TaxID=72036 RepID=A0A7R8CHV0_LEPSM|nr:unnamed protein product [Lepeophtheirus salmonis]CAF2823712.1 unnamed protein product [Lepeophtheirus salmonis]
MYTLQLLFSIFLASTAVPAKPQQSRSFFFSAQTTDQLYPTGSKGYLFVETADGGSIDDNDDWKTCTWTRMSDGKKCDIQYNCSGSLCSIGIGTFSRYITCDPELKRRVSFFGPGANDRNNFCGIIVSPLSHHDNSDWECSVEQCRVTGCGTEDGDGTVIKNKC